LLLAGRFVPGRFVPRRFIPGSPFLAFFPGRCGYWKPWKLRALGALDSLGNRGLFCELWLRVLRIFREGLRIYFSSD
jgi:hypothetical protein